jgi:hypothetical protein
LHTLAFTLAYTHDDVVVRDYDVVDSAALAAVVFRRFDTGRGNDGRDDDAADDDDAVDDADDADDGG